MKINENFQDYTKPRRFISPSVGFADSSLVRGSRGAGSRAKYAYYNSCNTAACPLRGAQNAERLWACPFGINGGLPSNSTRGCGQHQAGLAAHSAEKARSRAFPRSGQNKVEATGRVFRPVAKVSLGVSVIIQHPRWKRRGSRAGSPTGWTRCSPSARTGRRCGNRCSTAGAQQPAR